jgi:hypothetical protein
MSITEEYIGESPRIKKYRDSVSAYPEQGLCPAPASTARPTTVSARVQHRNFRHTLELPMVGSW